VLTIQKQNLTSFVSQRKHFSLSIFIHNFREYIISEMIVLLILKMPLNLICTFKFQHKWSVHLCVCVYLIHTLPYHTICKHCIYDANIYTCVVDFKLTVVYIDTAVQTRRQFK